MITGFLIQAVITTALYISIGVAFSLQLWWHRYEIKAGRIPPLKLWFWRLGVVLTVLLILSSLDPASGLRTYPESYISTVLGVLAGLMLNNTFCIWLYYTSIVLHRQLRSDPKKIVWTSKTPLICSLLLYPVGVAVFIADIYSYSMASNIVAVALVILLGEVGAGVWLYFRLRGVLNDFIAQQKAHPSGSSAQRQNQHRRTRSNTNYTQHGPTAPASAAGDTKATGTAGTPATGATAATTVEMIHPHTTTTNTLTDTGSPVTSPPPRSEAFVRTTTGGGDAVLNRTTTGGEGVLNRTTTGGGTTSPAATVAGTGTAAPGTTSTVLATTGATITVNVTQTSGQPAASTNVATSVDTVHIARALRTLGLFITAVVVGVVLWLSYGFVTATTDSNDYDDRSIFYNPPPTEYSIGDFFRGLPFIVGDIAGIWYSWIPKPTNTGGVSGYGESGMGGTTGTLTRNVTRVASKFVTTHHTALHAARERDGDDGTAVVEFDPESVKPGAEVSVAPTATRAKSYRSNAGPKNGGLSLAPTMEDAPLHTPIPSPRANQPAPGINTNNPSPRHATTTTANPSPRHATTGTGTNPSPRHGNPSPRANRFS